MLEKGELTWKVKHWRMEISSYCKVTNCAIVGSSNFVKFLVEKGEKFQSRIR